MLILYTIGGDKNKNAYTEMDEILKKHDVKMAKALREAAKRIDKKFDVKSF